MGQKVPVERPRVRSTDDREIRLGSYELFHRGEPLTETVWEKLMLGLTTRKYGEAVRQFTEAYGLEKSAVSEHFIESSRAKLKELMERRLNKMKFCALLIDATPFEGQQMVAALGIGYDGTKTILGIRQGATENATVVGELLGDLMNRGLDFTEPRIYVLDGGKALHSAVKKYAGEAAPIQRCQVHKRRNVLDHLSDDDKPNIAQKLNAIYAMEDYTAAKTALDGLHRELMHLNPSAARSLGEGLDETLTVLKLHVPEQLRKSLASTNLIESAQLEKNEHCIEVVSLAPASQVIPAAAGTGTVGVLTTAGCPWTAVSASPFLAITSGSSGTGPGTVEFSATANTAAAARTGALTVGGQTATVNQSSTAPILLLSPSSTAIQWTQGSPLPAAIPLSIYTQTSSLAFTASASSTGNWLSVSPAPANWTSARA